MEREVFVGRERELRQLDGFLHRALAGQGTVCFVTGEAGSGKTALVTEFARRAEETHADLVIAIGGCNAQTGIGDPYLPFREVLGLLTGDVEAKLAQGTITQKTAGRLRDFLRISGQTLVEIGPDLIGIFVPGAKLAVRAATFAADKAGWLERLEKLEERSAVVAGGHRLDQSRIFEQYTDVLLALAAKRPLMLVLDDLHWADASSISLLFHLGRRIGESRVLMLGTYRPEDVAQGRAGEQHPLEGVVSEFKRYLGDIWVDLGQAVGSDGQRFVDALLDMEANRLGESFRRELLRRTGGNALFTTELLRDMQERGALVRDQEGRWVEGPALDWGALPARVEGVIEKRIGWLEAEEREALTVASVEGEEFTAEVVARVQAVDERGFVRRLSGELEKQHHLVSAQGIRRLGAQRLSLYRFRHNLFHKYLYGSLDEVERAYLHEDVGNVLETLYGNQVGEISVQLARHFQEAGIADRAIDYLQQAANRAVRLSANQEAVAHLTKALELLGTLPDTPERMQQELTLQITLGQALVATKGVWGPGGRTSLRQRADAVRINGANDSDLPRAAGTVESLCLAGGVGDGAGTCRAAPGTGPAHARPGRPDERPPGTGGHLVMPRRVDRRPRAPGAKRCPLRPSAAPLTGLRLRAGPRGSCTIACGQGAVDGWLSRPGFEKMPREAAPSGPGVVSPPQPGFCTGLCNRVTSPAPRNAGDPGDGRGDYCPLD